MFPKATGAEIVAASPELSALVVSGRAMPLDRNPARVYLARLSDGSKRTMAQALGVIARIVTTGQADIDSMSWSALRYQHTAAIRATLMAEFRPATANKVLAALRGVLREAWRLGQMSAEDFHRATDVRTIKSETLPRGRALSSSEIATLMRVCWEDQSPAGVRDAALIGCLYGAGLRRSEAVALDASNFSEETGELKILGAKGRKDRLGYLTDGCAEALADWLRLRGPEPGPLFWRVNKGGRIVASRLTDQAVLYILRKRGAQAGVERFSPHDLRRSFITDLLDAGADIATVQRLANHASIATTVAYDRRGEVAKRKAARLLHVPYRNRNQASD